jgi:hypothetical protein
VVAAREDPFDSIASPEDLLALDVHGCGLCEVRFRTRDIVREGLQPAAAFVPLEQVSVARLLEGNLQ